MNIASKTLNKQRKRFITASLQGLAVTIIGAFVGFMLLTEGVGKSNNSTKGKAALLKKIIIGIFGEGADSEKIMAYILAGAMAIVVIFGIYYFLKGAYHMLPKHTILGQSIVKQCKNYEKFSDVLSAINTDMDRESAAFGKVRIGREWILEMEAMRLSQIKGIFWMNEGESDFVLCCVDDAENIWAASFSYEDERENAVKYLRSRYPEFVYGDKNAYISFLRQEMGEVQEAEEAEERGTAFFEELSPSTIFSYIRADGIPTSNFTKEEILDNVNHFVEGQQFAICPMSGESIEKISFLKSEGVCWEITIEYIFDEEKRNKVIKMNENETKTMLEELIIHKRLTNLGELK